MKSNALKPTPELGLLVPPQQLVVDDELRLRQATYREDDYYSVLGYDIVGADSEQRIGGVQLCKRRGDTVALDYSVDDEMRGRGIAPRSAARLLDFGFTELGLSRAVLQIKPDNTASQRVAQKLGAQLTADHHLPDYVEIGHENWLVERGDRG